MMDLSSIVLQSDDDNVAPGNVSPNGGVEKFQTCRITRVDTDNNNKSHMGTKIFIQSS